MMEEENTTTDTQGTENAPDLKQQMLDTVKEFDSDTQVEVEEKPAEEDNQEEEETPEEDKEEEDEEDKKRPNRYQRLKAKAEAAVVQAQKFYSEREEAVKIANIYRNRFNALKERYESLQSQASEVGYEPNAYEEENWALRLKEKERELENAFADKQQEEMAKQQILYQKEQMAAQFQQEALAVADQSGFKGEQAVEFARKVLKAYAFAMKADENVSMKEVASYLRTATMSNKQASALREQVRVNSGAPRSIRGGNSKVVDYPSNRDGMTAYLKSLGD